jgi:hypothetical protein
MHQWTYLYFRYRIVAAPIKINDASLMNILYSYISQYAQKKPVALNIRFPNGVPQTFRQFADFCAKHNILELYSWLSQRFPDYFVEGVCVCVLHIYIFIRIYCYVYVY